MLMQKYKYTYLYEYEKHLLNCHASEGSPVRKGGVKFFQALGICGFPRKCFLGTLLVYPRKLLGTFTCTLNNKTKMGSHKPLKHQESNVPPYCTYVHLNVCIYMSVYMCVNICVYICANICIYVRFCRFLCCLVGLGPSA